VRGTATATAAAETRGHYGKRRGESNNFGGATLAKSVVRPVIGGFAFFRGLRGFRGRSGSVSHYPRQSDLLFPLVLSACHSRFDFPSAALIVSVMRIRPISIALLVLAGCRTAPSLLVPDDSGVQLARTTIAAPNPAERGAYEVKFLYYGSGTDKNRAVYRDSVTIKTRAVNGTPYLRGGDPKRLKARWKYWGFDEKHLPVQARVWYPEGAGPFPLVLIVHGNHDMKQFSDPGYAYLGELLASRGYIVASVDENFLNGDLRNENDARGWMLLQHLTAWRAWFNDPGSPFYRKVDLTNIALIGHSRGGEAVAVAAAFNRLPRYPDDARVLFNFGFGIKSVIAIAPVDGQYKPQDKGTPIENVNYFVLHGSHDSDVQTFMGVRQYERVRFTDGGNWVKGALYVYRANHGQFNTVWGDNDVGDTGWLLNRSLLLTGEEQRQVAKVFIGGFLDLTLRNQRAYLPMFRDHRAAGTWLPKTIYLSQFDVPTTRTLADFEEGIDVTAGSARGVKIGGSGLATWKEVGLTMRSRGLQPFNNTVAMLGWTAPRSAASAAPSAQAAADTVRPTYTITLPDTLAAAWKVNAGSSIVFSLANYGEKARPLAVADTAAPADSEKVAPTSNPTSNPKAPTDSAKRAQAVQAAAQAALDSLPLDLSIELVLADGRTGRVRLSSIAPVRPPLTVRLWKYEYIEKRLNPPSKNHDSILAKYVVPLSAFAPALGAFDPVTIRAIRFRFDHVTGGTILLDDVGLDVPLNPSTP
jgi:dienelactone hydrolase